MAASYYFPPSSSFMMSTRFSMEDFLEAKEDSGEFGVETIAPPEPGSPMRPTPDLSAFGSPDRRVETQVDASFESPVRPPLAKRKLEETPEKNKAAKELLGTMDHEDVEASLIRGDLETLQKGVSALEKVTDTPNKKKRSDTASRTYRAFLQTATSDLPHGFSPTKHSQHPEFQRRISPRLLNSPWLGRMLTQVEEIHQGCEHQVDTFPGLPDVLVDLTHIASPVQGKKKKIGHHFCPKGTQEHALLQEKAINSSTRVFCAKYDDGVGGLKPSSYFPDWIPDEETLLALLLSGREIVRQNNRSLCLIEGDVSFIMESYHRERASRKILNSAFPIFSFTDLTLVYSGNLGVVLHVGLLGQETPVTINVDKGTLFAEATKMLRGVISSSIDLRNLPLNPMLHEEWLLRQPCRIDDATSPLRYAIPASGSAPARFVFDFAPLFADVTKVPKGMLVAIPAGAFKDIIGSGAIYKAMTAKADLNQR